MSVVKDGLSEMIFELRHLRGIRANFKKNVPEKGNNMWKEPKTQKSLVCSRNLKE